MLVATGSRPSCRFEPSLAVLPVSALLPLKTVPEAIKQTIKYKQIAKSVTEIGIIEPLVVARWKDQGGRYLLLDGHMRYAALVDMAAAEVQCLIAADDEAYTYNKRINRLATVQEHLMIVRAIERGVSEDKLANALNLDVKAIKRRRMLLVGVCPEVVELLKDKSVNPITFEVLRKMKPMRQIDAAELMSTAGNYTASYANALLAAIAQHRFRQANRQFVRFATKDTRTKEVVCGHVHDRRVLECARGPHARPLSPQHSALRAPRPATRTRLTIECLPCLGKDDAITPPAFGGPTQSKRLSE